jgi:hypothetical protein
MAALREVCLIRDRHRCVISRKFDDTEAVKRVERGGDNKDKDDDGHLLKDEAGIFTPLEVAHILPHSLMNISSGKTELVYIPSRVFISVPVWFHHFLNDQIRMTRRRPLWRFLIYLMTVFYI